MEETNREKGLLRFRRSGDLTSRKLAEYIPAMLITNISALLLISVDGIVAGNLVGKEALSAVNIFYPVTVLVGAITMLVASGVSTCLSTAMGKNDHAALDRIKAASVRVTIVMAAAVAIVQIPVVWLVVRSYGLSEEMYRMTMQYAVGIMICTPLGLISTVGTYQLQIAGKMKILMGLSVIEGLANLGFDLLYTGAFHMGIAGTGYGTATANIIRCTLTVLYLYRRTDMLRSDTKKVDPADVKNILGVGVPDASYALINALQSYLIMKILLAAFGTDGGVIKGVCTLCFSITAR
jgi:Na+-driven multidrug efflux pump